MVSRIELPGPSACQAHVPSKPSARVGANANGPRGGPENDKLDAVVRQRRGSRATDLYNTVSGYRGLASLSREHRRRSALKPNVYATASSDTHGRRELADLLDERSESAIDESRVGEERRLIRGVRPRSLPKDVKRQCGRGRCAIWDLDIPAPRLNVGPMGSQTR